MVLVQIPAGPLHAAPSTEPGAPSIDDPAVAGTPEQPPDPHAGDTFCGPRCVQFILSQYGIREELYRLIEEIQDPDWRKGSTLASVEQALIRRGVRTMALDIDRGAVLEWPHPVITHLEPELADSLGHFVVQLPATQSGLSRVWCGLAGIQEVPEREFALRRSETVLLTSRDAIDLPETSPGAWAYACPILLGVGVGVAAFRTAVVPRLVCGICHLFQRIWRKP